MKKMFYDKYNTFHPINDKESGFGREGKFWHLKSLLQGVKDQKSVKEKIYLNSIRHVSRWDSLGAIDMLEHYKRINEADLKYPIIINWDGMILDGYHRIVKALSLRKDRLRAYRINILDIKPDKE